jgi:hypothetical protein
VTDSDCRDVPPQGPTTPILQLFERGYHEPATGETMSAADAPGPARHAESDDLADRPAAQPPVDGFT